MEEVALVISPFVSDYGPDIDTSDKLSPVEALYYQYLSGLVRWMTKIRRFFML
jgi:hypothetical protein